MDGEVAQLAALVISANHHLAEPSDPMPWFKNQRAFASCGQIEFSATTKPRFGKPRHIPVARDPSDWLKLLHATDVNRVLISFSRQDAVSDSDEAIPDRIPDRIAAGFAGGGSLWTMTTETTGGGNLCWQSGWRAAYPTATNGRIWHANYMAQPCVSDAFGPSVDRARATLASAITDNQSFASKHHYPQIAATFASALCLLDGAPDPKPVPRPAGPADTLAPSARGLLNAAQRSWIFDKMNLWRDQDFSTDLWAEYAELSESLYVAVTAAIKAAVNSSAIKV